MTAIVTRIMMVVIAMNGGDEDAGNKHSDTGNEHSDANSDHAQSLGEIRHTQIHRLK